MTTSIMAANVFSFFGLRTQFPHRTIGSATVPSTPFINKQTLSLNISSWNSIRELHPLIFSRTSTMGSPVHRHPQPLTVVCASGYKMKTHKASAKRFRVSGSGKIMRRRAGKQHLLRKKNTKRRLRLSKMIMTMQGLCLTISLNGIWNLFPEFAPAYLHKFGKFGVQVDRGDYNNVIGALPYLKVNRSN
ncbi:hypothetical protein OROGR_013740 [Orobanche gracilis]